jgi:hypothetical protein
MKCFNPLESEYQINHILRFTSYFRENTLRIHCKGQSINYVCENNRRHFGKSRSIIWANVLVFKLHDTHTYMRSEVLTAVNIKTAIFVILPRVVLQIVQNVLRNMLPRFPGLTSNLKTVAVYSSEKLISIYELN